MDSISLHYELKNLTVLCTYWEFTTINVVGFLYLHVYISNDKELFSRL